MMLGSGEIDPPESHRNNQFKSNENDHNGDKLEISQPTATLD